MSSREPAASRATSGGLSDETVFAPPQRQVVPGTSADAATAPEGEGARGIGRFVVLGNLGTGSMGSVYRAYDPALRREVALKLVKAGVLEPDAELLMVREAQMMARLGHRNVVAIYDISLADGTVALAMEYVRGGTLSTWIGSAVCSWREVLAVFVQAAEGLAAAHAVGLVHRDFKPANVLVSEDGIAKVADFGIAKVIGRPSSSTSEEAPAHPCSGLDTRQEIAGTPRYMAPEQWGGARVDERCDQYAFCVALWEALCGARPFADLEAKRRGPPPWPRDVHVPSHICEAIRRGLAPDPEQRFASMRTLIDALTHDGRSRARSLIAGGAISILSFGAVVLAARHSERAQRCDSSRQLADTWAEPVRLQLREAVRATGVAYADETLARVEDALDRYAGDWKFQHRAACEATVRGEQSPVVLELRMACMHRARVELQSAVARLLRADERLVEHAVKLVSGLPPLARCENVAALQAEEPPPEDPEDAALVERAEEAIAAARSASAAGDPIDASEHLDVAQQLLKDVEHPPAHARLWLWRGHAGLQRGEPFEAIRAYGMALDLALAYGMSALAAESAAMLARTEGMRRPLDVLRLMEISMALTKHPSAREAEVSVRHAFGVLLDAMGQDREAESHFRRALELTEAQNGDEHPNTIVMRLELAAVLDQLGEHEVALRMTQRALEQQTHVLGPQHPSTGRTVGRIGMLLHHQARIQEAEPFILRGIAVLSNALSPSHPEPLRLREALAKLQLHAGRYPEAEAECREILVLQEQLLGNDHPQLAESLHCLGVALVMQARFPEAEEVFRRGSTSRENAGIRVETMAVEMRYYIGFAQSFQERHEEACASFETAYTLSRQLDVGEILLHARVAHALGETLAIVGREAEGRRYLEEAWRVRSVDTPGLQLWERSATAFELAKLMWKHPSERRQALELAELARDNFGIPSEVEKVTAWLDARNARRRHR